MFIFSFLSIVLLDQLTKLMMLYQGKAILNTGVSFAWFQEFSPSVLLALTMVLAAGMGVYFWSTWRDYPLLSGIFWGGVVSNIVDRLLLGGVTDWLTIPYTQFKNNLADIAIGIGLLGFVLMAIRGTNVRHTI